MEICYCLFTGKELAYELLGGDLCLLVPLLGPNVGHQLARPASDRIGMGDACTTYIRTPYVNLRYVRHQSTAREHEKK